MPREFILRERILLNNFKSTLYDYRQFAGSSRGKHCSYM